jgi:hypothetical protein
MATVAQRVADRLIDHQQVLRVADAEAGEVRSIQDGAARGRGPRIYQPDHRRGGFQRDRAVIGMSNVTRRSQASGGCSVGLLVLYLADNRVVPDSVQSSSVRRRAGLPMLMREV